MMYSTSAITKERKRESDKISVCSSTVTDMAGIVGSDAGGRRPQIRLYNRQGVSMCTYAFIESV